MKFHYLLSLVALLTIGSTFAQFEYSMTLKPDAAAGKDALIWYVPNQATNHGATNDNNYGSNPGLQSMEWTWSGSAGSRKSLLEFDLTGLPQGATLLSAELSLFGNVGSSENHSTLSGSNETLIQRVTSSWEEDLVTWNTAPTSTVDNAVVLPATTSATQDFLNVDVTLLVQDMLDNPSTSFGFMMGMEISQFYRSTNFASSDHTDPALHPELTLTYSLPCQTWKPSAANGKDAMVWYVPNQATNHGATNDNNYGTTAGLHAMNWTWSGSAGSRMSLLDFDLSSIPSNAVISSASLSLYHNEGSSEPHSTLSGSNEWLIERITGMWDENTVTWNTKPSITTSGQLVMPATTSSTEDFENINVTTLVQDMIFDPANSHGFAISLQNPDYYRAVHFASSDHANASLHPELEICLTSPLVTNVWSEVEGENIVIFPNPSTGNFTVLHEDVNMIKVVNSAGSIIMAQKAGSEQTEINLENQPSGIYMIVIESDENISYQSVMIK